MNVIQMERLLESLTKMNRIANSSSAGEKVQFRFIDDHGNTKEITISAQRIKLFMAEFIEAYVEDCRNL